MRKILFLAAALVLVAAPAFAGWPYHVSPADKTVTWVASSDSVMTSATVDLIDWGEEFAFFSVQYQSLSAMGTCSTDTVEVHTSNDCTNFVEYEGATDFVDGLYDENWHHAALEIPVSRCFEFISTTNSESSTDCTMTFKIRGW